MRRLTFAAGMGMIVTAVGIRATQEQTATWWAVLQDLTDEQWQTAVRRYLGELVERPREFPLPGVLRQLAPGAAGEEPMVLEAEAAWRRVLDECSVYTPESGTVWSARLVRDLVSEAAHRAVLDAGGYPQLELLGEAKTEFWARKRFVEAYRAQRAEGLPALPAAGERPALTEGRRGGELVHVTGRV